MGAEPDGAGPGGPSTGVDEERAPQRRGRAPLRTVAVGAAAVLAVLVAVPAIVSRDQASQEPVTPQELLDGLATADAPGPLQQRAGSDTSFPLPDERLDGFDTGPARRLADYVGTPLIVNFWASWCPPCVEEMPDLDALAARSGDRLGVLGVNRADHITEARRLVDELGVGYDLAVDGDDSLFAAVEGFGMPTTLFVDGSGTVVHRHTGGLEEEGFARLAKEHLGVDLGG